jgi:Predicted metal binding domain
MIVVDPEVTRVKLERELELWHENEETYCRRGWILLGRRELEVDVGFLGRLPLGAQPIPAMTACVRVDFTNYDLWPPSVEFINPFTGEYAPPPVQALVDSDEGPRNLVVHSHPETNRPFFCVPGVRQYHDHPQHSGDSWLLHRRSGEGSLATICDRIWRSMSRNLLGVHIEFQSLPGRLNFQLRVQNAPGEVVPAMWEQARQAELAARAGQGGVVLQPGQLPPQIVAALGLASPPSFSPPPEEEGR